MKAHKWDRGDPVPKTTRERMPWEIEMDKNRIPYDEDVLLWHWAERNRPVRCATHLTVYRNTSRTGVTVTDSGLESSTSFKDTFGAHSSRGDVNFVRLVPEPPSPHSPCHDMHRTQSIDGRIPRSLASDELSGSILGHTTHTPHILH